MIPFLKVDKLKYYQRDKIFQNLLFEVVGDAVAGIFLGVVITLGEDEEEGVDHSFSGEVEGGGEIGVDILCISYISFIIIGHLEEYFQLSLVLT